MGQGLFRMGNAHLVNWYVSVMLHQCHMQDMSVLVTLSPGHVSCPVITHPHPVTMLVQVVHA